MIITLGQTKGGVGKSTVATHLAVEYATRGLKVGLLDADPQHSAARWYNRRCKHEDVAHIEFKQTLGDISDTITAMSQRNRVLIIDTGGFDNAELRCALVQTNIVICPFRPKQFDLDEARHILGRIHEMRFANPRLKSYALINQAPTLARDSRADSASEYLLACGFDVLEQRLYHREAFGDCAETGQGAAEFTDSKADKEVKNLVEELAHG